MPTIAQLRDLSPAARLGLGCLVVGLLAIACLTLAYAWPTTPAPVATVGALATPGASSDEPAACSREAVRGYLAGNAERVDRLFQPINALGADGRSIRDLDLAELRAARDELAAEPVPECLTRLRDEEMALADMVIAQIERLQADRGPLGAVRATWHLIRQTRGHIGRIHDARHALEQRYDLTVPTP